MIYYAPGATHSPHHPTKEWVDKISAMHLFDKGFESVREQIFANQKRLGVIPQDAKLTPWPKDLIKSWDQHTPEEKKMLIKEADVYAAYLAYTDYETGRVMQAVADLGKLDNTIIVYINGDNGASAEGSAMGTFNEILPFNGVNPSAAENMKFYDAWGNNQTYPHYSYAWAWTFDTPYKWTKQIASYFGGTKNGMVISYPPLIKDKGGIRWQFHHVIDIVPRRTAREPPQRSLSGPKIHHTEVSDECPEKRQKPESIRTQTPDNEWQCGERNDNTVHLRANIQERVTGK